MADLSWFPFSIVATLCFSISRKKLQYSKEKLLLGLGIIMLSASGKIIQKLAADSVDIQAMQIFQYLSASLLSLIPLWISNKGEIKKNFSLESLKSGALIAIPGFLGG